MKNQIFLMLIAVLLVTGCVTNTSTGSSDKLDVIVSILPQKAFVSAVGGDHVNVNELIPPGGSPATYEPKPSELALVENADIYFRIGHIPFEKSHADEFSALNQDLKIVDTSINVELREFGEDEEHEEEQEEEHVEEECSEQGGTWIEEHEECEGISEEDCTELGGEFNECASACRHEEGEVACTLQCVLVCSFEDHEEEGHEEEHDHSGVDPHVWLAPMQVKKQVDTIAETLSAEDPANAAVYQANAEAYKKQLDELHEEIESKFTEINTDKLMVFHPAWGYFADEYGLEQVAIEQSGKEPTAEQLQHLIDEAKEEEIKVIFVQSQFNKEIAESVAEEVGAVVVSIDPLSEDYITNMRSVSTTIAENLNK